MCYNNSTIMINSAASSLVAAQENVIITSLIKRINSFREIYVDVQYKTVWQNSDSQNAVRSVCSDITGNVL